MFGNVRVLGAGLVYQWLRLLAGGGLAVCAGVLGWMLCQRFSGGPFSGQRLLAVPHYVMSLPELVKCAVI